MFQSYLIGIFLYLYSIYSSVISFIYSWVQPKIVYHVNPEGNKKNITWKYYLRLIPLHSRAKYHVIVFSNEGIIHHIFNGSLKDVRDIRINPSQYPLRRKSVAVLSREKPVTDDLNILDNYFKYINLTEGPVSNLGEIVRIIGIDGDRVTISSFRPFKKETHDIDTIDIQDIYH